MTTNRHSTPRHEIAGTGMPRLLTLRDVTAVTALSRSAVYALMASPEALPDRDPLDRQHRVPTVSKGEETPAVGTGSWPVRHHEPAYPMCVHWALARGRCAPPSNPRRRAALSC